MKKLAVLILFLGVSAGLIWLVWFRPVKTAEEEKKPEAEVPVHVGKVTRATLRSYVTAYGTVEPEQNAAARVAVGVSGVINSVKCVEGQHVERGALLFELDSRAADVAVKFAEKNLERQKKLAQTEGTSQKLLQEAEQQFDTARAQLALLKIHSPINGVVIKLNAKVGEAADLTSVLAEIVDLDRLVASFNVPSGELGVLKAGQPAEVSSPDSTNVVTTSLVFTSPQVDAKTGSGLARAAVRPNAGLSLGQFVRARVVTEEKKDCLAVPLTSVARDATGATFVALVDGEQAVLKPVKTGLRDGELVEVEGEGVEADKTVVTDGAYGLIMTQQFATKIRVVSE
jgi:membrane fusion protein (multidrug efflux system)